MEALPVLPPSLQADLSRSAWVYISSEMLLSSAASQRCRRPCVFAGCTGIILARSTSSFSLQFNALLERSFSSEIRASVSRCV